MRNLPPGVGRASQGQEQAYAQLFIGFAIAILSAIGLVYAVMVLLFRSFFKPLVILSALPTAIGGALAVAAGHRPVALDPLADRLSDADGSGGQELDPAGRIRHRARARGPDASARP